MQDQTYFKSLTTDQLQHSLTDIDSALKHSRTWQDSGTGERKYLDQLSAAQTEMNQRTGHNICKSCGHRL